MYDIFFCAQVFRNPIILVEENRELDNRNRYHRFVNLLKPIVENQGGTVEFVNSPKKNKATNNSHIDDFILKKV